MKISNETKVGILATIAIIFVILGINYLKGKNVFSRNLILYSKYANAGGLDVSNAVMLYGVQVGQVDEIKLISEGNKKVLVRFHVQGNVELPRNTIAKIVSSDFLGSKQVDLLPGTATVYAKKYDTLPGQSELTLTESISSVLAPVRKKLEGLISSVDTVVTTLNNVFNEDTKVNLRTSFRSIKESLDNIKHASGRLDTFMSGETNRLRRIFENVDRITENLRNNNGAITHAITNFSAITDSLRAANLRQTLLQTNAAVSQLNSVLKDVNQGKGSLGKLLKDDKLYVNLEAASSNLDKLVIDMKAHPSRYLSFSIFGKKRKDKDTAASRP